MSGMKKPRRKRRVYQQVDSPFPVPIESISKKQASDQRWFYYTGLLKANCVLIQQQGDVIFLYKMGFFGKGMLSKSKPEHNIFLNSYQGLRKKNLPPTERRFQQQRFQQVRKRRYERHLSWYRQFVLQSQKAVEMDCEDISTSISDEQAENHEEDKVDHRGTSCLSSEEEECCKVTRCLPVSSKGQTMEKDEQNTGKDYAIAHTNDGNSDVTETVTMATDATCIRVDLGIKRIPQESESPDENLEVIEAKNEKVSAEETKIVKIVDDVTDQNDVEKTYHKHHRESDTMVTMETAESGWQESLYCIPASCSSSPDQDESESIEESEDQGLTRKEDPYKIHEYLQLKLEEAFFLSYGLGCLSVIDESKKALDLTEMWQAFCSRQKNFVATYVAYHYYRSKGWVPRDGVKYGANFVLYKHGPPFYHGSYSVIVQMVTNGTLDDPSNTMTWPALSGIDRITETVVKEVIVCYVLRPPNLTDEEIRSPKCIPEFRVQEIVMRRWVSSRERDLKDQIPPLIS